RIGDLRIVTWIYRVSSLYPIAVVGDPVSASSHFDWNQSVVADVRQRRKKKKKKTFNPPVFWRGRKKEGRQRDKKKQRMVPKKKKKNSFNAPVFWRGIEKVVRQMVKKRLLLFSKQLVVVLCADKAHEQNEYQTDEQHSAKCLTRYFGMQSPGEDVQKHLTHDQ